jgi:DNA invertase Pin-like site-specific DNA recombinase
MAVYGYVRVSTDRQVDDGESLALIRLAIAAEPGTASRSLR